MKLTQQLDNAVAAGQLFTEDEAREKRLVYTSLHERTNEVDRAADLLEQLAEMVRSIDGSERLAKRLISWSNELDTVVHEMRAEIKASVGKPTWD